MARDVFISGGTGYMGRVLVRDLIARGHRVKVLARPESEKKVPAGAVAARGNALREDTFATGVKGCDTFVHLAGVAHPAPMMRAYIQVRTECEKYIEELGLTCTILRPWYVLGPGHWWPVALKPVYAILEALPSTRDAAKRLGLVTLQQMAGALTRAVENPPQRTRIVDVPAIRNPHLVGE